MSDDVSNVSSTTGPAITLGMVVLDTPDPRGLARFYAELLDWQVDPDDDDDGWVTISGAGGTPLAFQLSAELPRVTWPAGSVPQQFHLDLDVSSYEDAEARALALGAVLLDASEDHPKFRVYADPTGHPFCLCLQD